MAILNKSMSELIQYWNHDYPKDKKSIAKAVPGSFREVVQISLQYSSTQKNEFESNYLYVTL